MNDEPREPLTEEPSSKNWRSFRNINIDHKSIHKKAKKAERDTKRHAHKFIIKRLENLKLAQRAIIVWLAMIVVIFAAIGVQYIWYQGEYKTDAAALDGTYAEGVVGQISTLNPLFASTVAETAASNLLFSSLYRHDSYGSLSPDVASSMTIDPSGKKYTVKLRDDVVWHDGQKLTAEDVGFTVDMIRNPSARVRSSLRANWLDIKSNVVDATTIEFLLPSRYASFPEALTFPIVPKHILKGVSAGAVAESGFSRSPVGSGPFAYKLLQVVNKQEVRKTLYLVANDEYYRGAPKLARFELQTYKDNAALVKALHANEIIAAADADVSGEQIDESRYKVQSHTVGNAVYLLTNTTNEVLKDGNVRRAIQAAIDTKAVREVAGNNVGDLHLPFLNSQVSGNNVPKPPKTDAKRAGELLDKAGWKLSGNMRKNKEGRELKLSIKLTKNSQFERVANELAKQLRAVGITVKVESIDTTLPGVNFVQNVLQARNYELLLYELPIGADPDVYPYWHSSQLGVAGYNFTNYSNDTADAALVSARDTIRDDLRNEKYIAFARQWLNDAPAVGLYQQSISYVQTKQAETMRPNAELIVPTDRFTNVQNWTVARQTVYKTP